MPFFLKPRVALSPLWPRTAYLFGWGLGLAVGGYGALSAAIARLEQGAQEQVAEKPAPLSLEEMFITDILSFALFARSWAQYRSSHAEMLRHHRKSMGRVAETLALHPALPMGKVEKGLLPLCILDVGIYLGLRLLQLIGLSEGWQGWVIWYAGWTVWAICMGMSVYGLLYKASRQKARLERIFMQQAAPM